MTCTANRLKTEASPPSGWGFCPACRTSFDLTHATPAFVEIMPHTNDRLVYVLCPECTEDYSTRDARERQSISNGCFINFKLSESPSGHTEDWAVTSTLTLALNCGSLVDAHELGHGLTRSQYDEACRLPMSLALVQAWNVRARTSQGGQS